MGGWSRKGSHVGIENLGTLRQMLCTPSSVNMITFQVVLVHETTFLITE